MQEGGCLTVAPTQAGWKASVFSRQTLKPLFGNCEKVLSSLKSTFLHLCADQCWCSNAHSSRRSWLMELISGFGCAMWEVRPTILRFRRIVCLEAGIPVLVVKTVVICLSARR